MNFEDWWDQNWAYYKEYGGINTQAISKAAWEVSGSNTVTMPEEIAIRQEKIWELEASLSEKKKELEECRSLLLRTQQAWDADTKAIPILNELREKVRLLLEWTGDLWLKGHPIIELVEELRAAVDVKEADPPVSADENYAEIARKDFEREIYKQCDEEDIDYTP